MGNINTCCPKSDLCIYIRDKENIILSDLKIVENYPLIKITKIQSFFRGYNIRRKIKNQDYILEVKTYGINSKIQIEKNELKKDKNDEYNNNSKSREDINNLTLISSNLKSKKSDKNKPKNKISSTKFTTPNGFLKDLMPGRLLLDEEIEKIKLKEKVVETENLLGAFIIEEKEVIKYLEDYKYKLKKYQMTYEKGNIYIGYFNPDWEWEGYGILLLQDGSKYEGMFQKNRMSGRGRLIGIKGDYFEGEFEFDKASGFGKYVNKDGGIYIGYWKDDKQNGRGEELFADGSRYEGLYEDGLKHGKGKFTWPDGSQYDGDFVKNSIDGYGIYRWRDGRIFQGEWRNNKMEGVGIFIWPDKKKYIGQYVNDKKSGFGFFIWPGGKKYEGEWFNGKQNGYGILTYCGQRKFGIWKEGQKEKWITNGETDDQFKNITIEIKKITDGLSILNYILKSDDSPKSDSF